MSYIPPFEDSHLPTRTFSNQNFFFCKSFVIKDATSTIILWLTAIFFQKENPKIHDDIETKTLFYFGALFVACILSHHGTFTAFAGFL